MKARPDRSRRDSKGRTSAPPKKASAVATPLQEGVRLLQQNDLEAARRCFDAAAAVEPANAVAFNCLGIVARMQRRLDEALRLFQRAIQLRPEFAEAHNNLGNVLRDAGRLGEASECYERAIALKPEFADPYNNLGVVQLSRGAIEEAIRSFEEAIRRNPQYPEAHNNLANAFRQRGELIDAVASFTTALQLRPASPEIHNNLGNVLRELGDPAAAQRHYVEAIRLKQDFGEAYGNLGTVLVDLEQADAAVPVYQHAVHLQPTSADALVNLGNAYKLVGQTELAREAYRRAHLLEPHRREHRLRSRALCPVVFQTREQMDEYLNQALAEWYDLADGSPSRQPWQFSSDLTEPSFNWQFLHGNIRPIKEAYAHIFGDDFAQVSTLVPRSGQPKIGIVVTSGHEGLFLRSMRGVLERLDTSAFQIVIVCSRSSERRLRDGIARDLDFTAIPPAVTEAARVVRDARLDVLYYWEIGTDATNYYLPFLRLAPVQCTSWGIQVTSGIPKVDYYLSSSLVEPANAQQHYTEQLRLAPGLLTYQYPPAPRAARKGRAELGLPARKHLYVCAQQPGKFHPDFDGLLAGILRADSEGVVVLAGDRYGQASRKLRERFEARIPDVADRIVLQPRLAADHYFELLAAADVLLDPPHFGGVNSTYDAFALGQPIVTCPSEFHRGRYTAGCYRKMGLDGCVARTREEYVQLAVTLGTEPDLRERVRNELRKACGVLFHDLAAVHEHQRFFSEMVERARTTSR